MLRASVFVRSVTVVRLAELALATYRHAYSVCGLPGVFIGFLRLFLDWTAKYVFKLLFVFLGVCFLRNIALSAASIASWRVNFPMIAFLESQIWANLCSSCCTYRDCPRDCLDCSQSQSGSHKHHITNGALCSKPNVSDSLTGIRKYFNQMVNVVCHGCTYQRDSRTGSPGPSTYNIKFHLQIITNLQASKLANPWKFSTIGQKAYIHLSLFLQTYPGPIKPHTNVKGTVHIFKLFVEIYILL